MLFCSILALMSHFSEIQLVHDGRTDRPTDYEEAYKIPTYGQSENGHIVRVEHAVTKPDTLPVSYKFGRSFNDLREESQHFLFPVVDGGI